jgi:hypothetical protein
MVNKRPSKTVKGIINPASPRLLTIPRFELWLFERYLVSKDRRKNH